MSDIAAQLTIEARRDFSGYHKFVAEDGSQYGSFEVFFATDDEGWFWWPCFPTCFPEDDPTGPFPTAEGAYLSAIGD